MADQSTLVDADLRWSGPRWAEIAFYLATTPARWLGRVRRDLLGTLVADANRYQGTAARGFAVLAGAAVLVPLVGSVLHLLAAPPNGDILSLALRPGFNVVYSESLPFMVAAFAIGMFSPALGVLFMTVFIPADLIVAANLQSQLSQMYWQPAGIAILGRLASLGLLWILAVEIPVATRRFAAEWASRRRLGGPAVPVALARAVIAMVLVFLWARAVPALIITVFTWSALQAAQSMATDPLWFYWQGFVVIAGAIAAASALLPRTDPAVDDWGQEFAASDTTAPSLPSVLLKQTVVVVVLTVLLGGMMRGPVEGFALFIGLLIAGPILTPVLPRISVPGLISRMPRLMRWLLALVGSVVVAAVIVALIHPSLGDQYDVVTLAIAVAAPLFRVLVDAGAKPDTPPAAGLVELQATTVAVSSLMALLVLVGWLALPAMTFADDCRDNSEGERKSCPDWIATQAAVLAGGAILGIGAAVAGRKPPASRIPTSRPTIFHISRSDLLKGARSRGGKPPAPEKPPPPFWHIDPKWLSGGASGSGARHR